MRRFLLVCVLIITTGFSQAPPKDQLTIIVELDESPENFISEIESRLPRLEVVAQYDTIFNGVAVRGSVDELEKLARMDAVTNQHPVKTYRTQQEPLSFSTDTIRSLGNSSYTGRGVKVGVIDTGIDYSHPDLQINYRGGFDTVDFDNDPMETLTEGATVHGTHVAGVIGANGKMRGIAPDAEIYAYRALGPGGMGSSVQVIAAIEEAVEDGMDVINLSLGNDVNGPDWPTSHAVDRAIEMGTTVVVAAGNSGPDDWTVGSPATSPDAITVGAVALPSEMPVLEIGRRKIMLTPLLGSSKWSLTKKYPLHFAGKGEGEIENARGKIVVFERGIVPFYEKAEKAYRAGAEAAIIYNNEEGGFQGSLNGMNLPIPVVAVTKKEGEWLLEQKDQWAATVWEELDQRMAEFSSRGPITSSWAIKPDVVAPGVDIMSTVPGGYAPLQGTSMAAPHVAGLAALVKEAHPDWEPKKVKQALMSGAEVLDGVQPTEQGMGYIDIERSIEPSLLLDGKLEFGRVQDKFFRDSKTVTITNPTDKEVKVQMRQPGKNPGETWSVPGTTYISPGATEELQVELQISGSMLSDGVHEGYLVVESSSDEYHIPYLYIKESGTYAKVSGFELSRTLNDQVRYRFYLSEQTQKLSVDLYRSGTMVDQGRVLEIDNNHAGMVEGTIDTRKEWKGAYVAAVTATIDGEEFTYTFPVFF
ncbi:S8 family serine peptidase [Halobacillus salinus]|uniref:Peptidase n=1 Tax=Halobacillus salinus TaxID=192814 RepID=A0A4Z0GWA5_9BACI|nr:S8 family serine peptidase [Halobacillus salinus]TGB01619.1 peptidase [Halobacillus salinus]